MKTINDWEKVVRSLIRHLAKDGIEITRASNGEDDYIGTSVAKLASKVCECDEGTLNVKIGEDKATLYIVLGNNPSETVADYGYREYTDDIKKLDTSLTAWSEGWERKGDVCPKKVIG